MWERRLSFGLQLLSTGKAQTRAPKCLAKKRPPKGIGRRLRPGELDRGATQPVQLIGRTNRDNYKSLISYQLLILQRSYVKIHVRLAPIEHSGLSLTSPLPRASRAGGAQ
jgi:hypothetical protein